MIKYVNIIKKCEVASIKETKEKKSKYTAVRTVIDGTNINQKHLRKYQKRWRWGVGRDGRRLKRVQAKLKIPDPGL